MVIMDAMSKPCERGHTPRSCMLAAAARVHKKHRKCGVNKEMEGRMVRGSIEPLSLTEMTMTMKAVMNDLNHRKTRHLSTQKQCTSFPSRLHLHTTQEKDCQELRRLQRS